jgi:hypothetical protein
MPMIRCPRCKLRQYAPAMHTTPAECVGCGRPLTVESAALIPRAIVAGRAMRRGSRRRTASDRS